MNWKKHSLHLLWIIPVIVVDVFIVLWLQERGRRLAEDEQEAALLQPEPQPVRPPWKGMVYPTDQTNLLQEVVAAVFQPTASGNPESALYGSVRTVNKGGGILPSFHEGVDIAALERDRAGRPLDEVRAVAEGKVAYINRVAGNSNYGKYVVLLHHDPMGEIYTLYAHLAEAARDLAPGQAVHAGQTIGRMGNTSSSPIPMARGHLHFEIGLINNMRFVHWYRSQKLKPDHGNFHGRNFLGVDPREVFRHHGENADFDFASHLARVPTAFEVVLRAAHKPDVFQRYPALWSGAEFSGGVIVVACSDNGVLLKGRNATEDEAASLGKNRNRVQNVNTEVLGRNGARIVVPKAGRWQLGESGQAWLAILTY